MSIQSQINRIRNNLSAAYTAIGSKGGIVPDSKISGYLASAINSIPQGVELNFEVVGGTSAPVNPGENTIWVNTGTAVSDVVFSAEAPAAPNPGTVWIRTGNSSPVAFDATEEPTVTVCPLYAKQYVDGAWVAVTAKSWQNDDWVDWVTFIYYHGNLTYYMESKELKPTSSYTRPVSDALITNTGESYYIEVFPPNSNTDGGGVAYFTKKVDLTNASVLYVKGDFICGSSSSFPYVGIWSSFGTYANNNRAAGVSPCYSTNGDTVSKTVVIDVSGLSGSYYIGFCLYTVDNVCSVLVHEAYYQ